MQKYWRGVMLGAFGALLLGCGLFLGLWSSRGDAAPPPAPVGVTVIPLPSATFTAVPVPTASSIPPTVLPPSPPAGTIVPGAFVQIQGTAGEGLRLRAAPGLQGAVNYLGLEAEVFEVQDGPVQADGYTWWYLVAPFDATKQGWAASNYLQVVQSP
ncbi:MAG: hypothetical protein D6755_06650 [Anaerolineae bacterium]|nr:MAG: hypothetical protein D6755_06650 [Anaerolineae bacterium]